MGFGKKETSICDNTVFISHQEESCKSRQIIKNALKNLNQREIMVTQLYYVEELNVYEIADILQISTGRISQIKKTIVEKLRKIINEKIT